jgi:hypothetical protein
MRTITRVKKALIRRSPILKYVQTAFYHLKPYEWKYRAYYLDHGLTSNPETVSGPGSTLAATQAIRAALPTIIESYHICSVLDIPCGDFHWMKELDLSRVSYLGIDIVAELITENRKKYQRANIHFECGDLIKEVLQPADLFICRDWMTHFSFPLIRNALTNLVRSRSKYLLATTYPKVDVNEEIRTTGLFRPLNLQFLPFSFPEPLVSIEEQAEFGKSVALWRVDTIPLT